MSKKWIAFGHGGIVPAGMIDEGEVTVPPHKAVLVPATYADQLVENRFAYYAEAPAGERAGRKRGKADLGPLEEAVRQAEAALAAADEEARPEAEAALARAQQDLEAAKA